MTEQFYSTLLKARTFKSASSGKTEPFRCGITESLLTRQSRTMMFTTRMRVFVTDSESLYKVRNLSVSMDWSLSPERDKIDVEMSKFCYVMINEICSSPPLPSSLL